MKSIRKNDKNELNKPIFTLVTAEFVLLMESNSTPSEEENSKIELNPKLDSSTQYW